MDGLMSFTLGMMIDITDFYFKVLLWNHQSSVLSFRGWLTGNVLGLLSCLMQCHGFDPSLRRIFPVEGIFPLELTWVLTPFPKKSFGQEYKTRPSLCTQAFHHTDSWDPDIHALVLLMPVTKTHPACTIHKDGMWLPQWLDCKTVTYTKISPKMVNLRDIAQECRRGSLLWILIRWDNTSMRFISTTSLISIKTMFIQIHCELCEKTSTEVFTLSYLCVTSLNNLTNCIQINWVLCEITGAEGFVSSLLCGLQPPCIYSG